MDPSAQAQEQASPTYHQHEQQHHDHSLLDRIGDSVHRAAVHLRVEDADSRDHPHSAAAIKRAEHQRAEEEADAEQAGINAQATANAHPARRDQFDSVDQLATATAEHGPPGKHMPAPAATFVRPTNDAAESARGTAGDDLAI